MANANDISDGTLSFVTGQNASLSPDKVPETGYYSGVNTSTDRGVISPRWGVEELNLVPTEQTFKVPTGLTRYYQQIYDTGKFQALIPYSINNIFYVVAVVSGVIFLINQETLVISVIPIADGSILNPHAPRINWSEAGRYLVIFDFPARPVILEGISARRSNASDLEIPVSRLGVFNQTRLIIANGGNEFIASDPAAYGFPFGPISFTEYLQTGSPYLFETFQIGTNYNNDVITGMYGLPVIDRSTEIGPTLVSTARGIYSYQTQDDRSTWRNPGFGTQFIPNIGFAGPRSMDGVNSDVWFMSGDGQVRSASMSRNDQTKWSKVPLSREVQNYLKVSDKKLLTYSRVCYYKNKIFITANPYREVISDTNFKPIFEYASGGFVVLELDNMSSLTLGDSAPAWGGLWTGLRPMDMIVNNEEAFIMSKEGGKNKLYKVRPDIRYDIIGPSKRVRQIPVKIYTKEYDFKSAFNEKQLTGLEVSVTGIQGKFKLTVKYKSSQTTEFQLWRTFEHEAPWRICDVLSKCLFAGLAPHEFKALYMGTPIENECSPVNFDKPTQFRKIQLLFEIEGVAWELIGFDIRALMVSQNITKPTCDGGPVVEVCKVCNTDWIFKDDIICQEM